VATRQSAAVEDLSLATFPCHQLTVSHSKRLVYRLGHPPTSPFGKAFPLAYDNLHVVFLKPRQFGKRVQWMDLTVYARLLIALSPSPLQYLAVKAFATQHFGGKHNQPFALEALTEVHGNFFWTHGTNGLVAYRTMWNSYLTEK
jgi:hypothetical protein